MPGAQLRDAIADALNHDAPNDVIEGVKAAVIAEIENLDPSAKITKTDYFNHSYAPDLVLKWKSGARKEEERELYLRFSLRASRAGRDADLLGKSGPIFLSMDSANDDEEAATSVEVDIQRAPRSLFTNVPALDRITRQNDSAESASSHSAASPLLNLFRRNVVRGGRGLIVRDTTDRLGQAVSHDGEEEVAYVDRFQQAVEGVFDEAATLRLRRAADLVRIALSGEIRLFDPSSDGSEAPERFGKLDDTELRALLPFLLDRGHAIDDVRFWRYLGGMLSLSQLENMATLLGDRDLSALARANLSTWRAARSMLSFNADAIDSEEYVAPAWRMHGGTLAANAGVWNIHFSTNNSRGGRPRADQTRPSWEDVASHLAGFSVAGVDLQGVIRRISIAVDPESNTNVLGDAVAVQDSVDDTFRVTSLQIRPAAEDSSDINLDFTTLTAAGVDVSISDLVLTSLRILGHRYPVDDVQQRQLLES